MCRGKTTSTKRNDMNGYRPLTESEKAEQKENNTVSYYGILFGVILGIVLFFTVSHMTGLFIGSIIALLALNDIEHSDMTDTDSGTCGE
jgi:hypothetical protein